MAVYVWEPVCGCTYECVVDCMYTVKAGSNMLLAE